MQATVIGRFRLLYQLNIDNHVVRVTRGKPPAHFLGAVRDIVLLHDIDRGYIECKGTGRHARLRFSSDFPPRGRQAIRNVWTPPTAPGPGNGRRTSG